jgi:hypothetical protein
VEWGLCKSDHAAMICLFEQKSTKTTKKRSNIPYLSNAVLNNPLHVNQIKVEVGNKMQQVPTHWNLHMKLEFLKMVMRTVVTEIDAKQRKERNTNLKWVNKEIQHLMETLQGSDLTETDEIRIKSKLHHLFIFRDSILDEQGEELAIKAKSKWYHEGECSNKYFLNTLKRKAQRCEISELRINNEIETNPTKINEEILKFYNQL